MLCLALLLPQLVGLVQCTNEEECNALKEQIDQCAEKWAIIIK